MARTLLSASPRPTTDREIHGPSLQILDPTPATPVTTATALPRWTCWPPDSDWEQIAPVEPLAADVGDGRTQRDPLAAGTR